MSYENNCWLSIETLPEKYKIKRIPILVCDASVEENCGYNFPQVVIWKYDHWILTWNHEVFDKPITHYMQLYLSNGGEIR